MIWRAVLLCLLMAAAAMAQTGASVDVRVTDSKRSALASATLALWPANQSVRTDEHGEASFDELAAGEYRVEASARGFAARDTSFDLSPGERLDLSLALQKLVETLPEVVVETARQTGDVRLFGRKEIEASAARNLSDFLNTTAGLEVRTDGTAGSAQTVRIGGSNANQVLVLVDGRRLQNLGSGEADLSSIPLDWVQSVEISRGGKTDEGGEAIGGVLRVTTLQASDRNELSAGIEAYPTYSRMNFLRTAKTGTFSGLLSYCRTQGPGNFRYTVIEDDGNGPFTQNLGKTFRRLNDDISRDQLLLKVASTLSSGGMVEASGMLDRAARGMPGYPPQLTPDARQNTSHEALNVRALRSLGKVNLEARAAYQQDWREYNDPGIYSNLHYSSETSREWETELQAHALLRRTSVSGGLYSARESLISEQIAGGYASLMRWAGWAQIGQPLWSAGEREFLISGNGGVRWEKFGSGQSVLPKVGLTFEHSSTFASGVTVSWGRSYRAPSFYSLFWLDDQTAQGNPNLRAEVSAEWTGRGYCDAPFVRGLRFEANASSQDVENLIYWKRTFDNRWKPFNLSRAKVRTLDLSLEQSVYGDHLRLSAGVNWTEARDATDDRNTGGKYLTFRAPRSYRGSLMIKQHRLELTASYRWVSARPVLETNSKWLQDYQVADLRLSYSIHLRQVQIEPSVGANNLFNEDYRLVRFAPMPEREIFAALRLSRN